LENRWNWEIITIKEDSITRQGNPFISKFVYHFFFCSTNMIRDKDEAMIKKGLEEFE
jgi:hypothetical protein